MTDKKDAPGQKDGKAETPERGGNEGGGSKRPFATIDLKAVEVRAEAGKGAPKAPSAAAVSAKAQAADGSGSGSQAEAARKVVAAQEALKAAGASTPTGATATEKSSEAIRKVAPPGSGGGANGIAPRRGGGSFIGHAISALAGAAIALLAAPYVAPQMGQLLANLGLPAPQETTVPPVMADRIARLEAGLAEARSGNAAGAQAAAAVAAAQKRIDTLAVSLTELHEAQAKTAKMAADAEAGLAKANETPDRLKRVEDQVGTLASLAASEPDKAGRIPQLAQITTRLAELDAALSTRLTEVRRDMLRAVEQRSQPALEASEAAKATSQRFERDLGAVKAENDRIATQIDQAKTASDRLALSLKATQDETAQLVASVDGLKRDIEVRIKATAKPADVAAAVSPLESQVATLKQDLGNVVKSEGERKAIAERIVLSLELGNLKRAMERGVPYARELADVRQAGGAKLDLAALEPYKDKGVPTVAQLAQGFRTVANSILDAQDEMADGTVVEKLLSGARTFVRVRRTAPGAGETGAEAQVARMEAALKAGRLGDVLAEAKTLGKVPDTAKDWLAKVAARQSVDQALAQVDETLKASLGGGAAPKKGQP
ncbi:MAG: hypothetical protein JSS20_02975 [Proteobacteria bacterium]|nr:hypothetical protein [Pseudomonadota bacterium]